MALLFSGCCTKKKCAGPPLPELFIKFVNINPNESGSVMLYTYESSVLKDSASVAAAGILLFPFQTFQNTGISYTLKWDNKIETVSNITCDFKKEKVNCNQCFPFGDGSEKIDTFSNFTFQNKGNTFHQGDTLFIAW